MHRALRARACVLAFALASAGCGGSAVASGSTLPSDDHETEGTHTWECGTYSRVGEGTQYRDGELATVPYLEVVLGDADPCAPLPLVVVLHGLGDRPIVPRWPYRDLPVPVRIVLPHGPIVWGDGYAWSSVRTLDAEEEGLVATMGAQGDRVAGLVDALVQTFSPPGPVVLAGFSQGGILALTVLMQHPAHLGLVMPLAAWVPPELRTAAGEAAPPIRWMHGLDDERVPYEMALETATDLRSRGYDVELVGYPGQRHSMSDAEDARFHSWLSAALTNQAAGRPIAEGFVLEP